MSNRCIHLKNVLLIICTFLGVLYASFAHSEGEKRRGTGDGTEEKRAWDSKDKIEKIKTRPLVIATGPAVIPVPSSVVANDPIRFDINISNASPQVGEELEITLSAELLDISPALMFFLEGSNEFSLKLVTPKGFVRTGGDYADFIGTRLHPNGTRRVRYTLKGKFESIPGADACFQLLRGAGQADASSKFVFKGQQCVTVGQERDKNAAARVDETQAGGDCSSFAMDLSENSEFQGKPIIAIGYNLILDTYSTHLACIRDQNNVLLNCQSGGDYASLGASGRVTAPISSPGTYGYTFQLTTSQPGCTLASLAGSKTVTAANFTPVISHTGALCEGSSVSLNVSGCGSGSIVWYRNGSVLAGNGLARTTSQEGTYTVKCDFGSSGLSNASQSVTIQPKPNLSIAMSPVSETNFEKTFNLSLSGCNGTVTWDYNPNWTASTVSITAAKPCYEGGARTYTAYCNSNGCSFSASYNVHVDAVNVDNEPTITSAGCSNNQGSIVFSGPDWGYYGYYWGDNSLYPNNPRNATNLPSGTYQIFLTTGGGICVYSKMYTVPSETPPHVDAGGDKTITCTNTSVNLNGHSNTPNVTYQWQTPGGVVNGQNLQGVSTPGDYTLIVTSSQGCTSSSTIKVHDITSYPNASVPWPGEVTCNVVSLTANGYSDATYTWERNGNVISQGQNVTISEGGNYKLTIRFNGNGCDNSSSATIGENKFVYANAGNDKVITCSSPTVQLDGNGSGNSTARWTTSDGNIVGNYEIANPIVNKGGTYRLTVTNLANGCVTSDDVTVTEDKGTPWLSASGGERNCHNGGTTVISASSEAGVSYSWSGPNGFSSSQSNPAVSSDGSYTVTVTKGNGCTSSTTVGVTSNLTPPSVNLGGDRSICAGGSMQFNPSVTAGVAPYSYSWSPSSGLSATNIPNPSANPSSSVYYTLSVTGANGCTGSNGAWVNVNAPVGLPTVTVRDNKNEICSGDQVIFDVSDYDGAIDWGHTTQDYGISPGASITVSPTQTTTYWFAIIRNGCSSARVQKQIVVNPLPNAPTLTASENAICTGGTTVLTAANCSGGTVDWVGLGNTASVTVAPLSTTTYQARCISGKGCASAVAQIQIVVKPIPGTPSITASSSTVCSGDAVTLNTSASCMGGTIRWSNGMTGPSVQINPTATASYTARCEVNGCQSPESNSVLVTVNERPTAPSATTALNYCLNSTATALTTSSGTSLKWYSVATGGTGSSTAPVPATTTVGVVSYYVSQTNVQGCEGPRTKIDVTTRALPDTLSALSQLVQYCRNSTPVSLKPVGTASGLKSLWYTAATGGTPLDSIVPTTNVVGTQTYYYSRKELAYNCESLRRKVTVRINAIPGAPSVTAINICKNSTASPLTATPSPGGTIKWYTALTGGSALSSPPVPSTTTAGTTNYYASQVVNGCESTRATLAVTVRAISAPTVPNNGVVNYCTNSTATALTATGTNLVWYSDGNPVGSSTAPIPSTANVGTFTYYVSQVGTTYGCESAKTTITVHINAAPSAPTTAGQIYKCQGATPEQLTAAGENIKWYMGATGGTALTNPVIPNLNIAGTTTYYASQTNGNGCESPTRTALVVTVYPTPTVTTPSNKILCVNQSFSAVTLTSAPSGATCDWRVTNQSIAAALGMTVFSGTNTIPAFTTQNSQSVPVTVVFELTPKGNGCEGVKSTFSLTVSPKPSTPVITASSLFICPSDTVYLTATNVDTGALLSWSTGQSGLDSIRVIPIENSVYRVYATKDGCTGDTAVSDTIYVSRLELQSKPTIDCDPETRTGAISASVQNANSNWITTFKIEKLIGGYGELMSDSLSENWIAGNLGANGVSYSGLKNGIYRILARQLPADLPPDQAGRDFCITYSDTVTVQCQKFRKQRVRSERCGEMSPLDLSNQTFLYKLMPGDTIWAGDFDVIIVEAQKIGSNGTFSGKGYVKMPKLFNAQVAVTFENAVFNDDFELIQGKIDAVYDPTWQNIVDVNQFIKDAKVLANTIGDAVTYAVDALITTSAERIESITDELVRNARENLPDDLQERVITATQEYKAAKAAYDNATTEAERDAAKAKFEAAQDKLEALKAETEQFVNDFQNIIILSLESIQQEKNTSELNRLKDNVNTAAQALNLPTAPEQQFSESMTNLIYIEGEEVASVRNSQEQAYYDAQKAYLKAQVASIFASKMKNAKGAKQVGETLKREGTKLSSYIYEAKKQQVAESTIVAEVKSIIYSALEKTLKDQVYEK